MTKNAIIALVVGLIIGGLVIFLVMGFTDAGTTMIIGYKGADTVKTKAIESQTADKKAAGTISETFDFTITNVRSATFTGKDGSKYSYTGDMSGDLYTGDNGMTIAKIKRIVITDMTQGLIDLSKNAETFINDSAITANTTSLQPLLQTSTEVTQITDFLGANPSYAKEKAAADAITTRMLNLDGLDQTSLNNLANSVTSTTSMFNKLKTETGADSWAIGTFTSFEFSPEFEKANNPGIELSWKGAKHWILHGWDWFWNGDGKGGDGK